MLGFAFGASALSMMLLPLAAGLWWAKRTGARGAMFGVGALTFIGSQVLHIPFNWAAGQGVRASGWVPPAWLVLPLVAIGLGLSAGVFEEVARLVSLRWIRRRAGSVGDVAKTRATPSCRDAIMLGLGHGGVEAMITGALVGLQLVNMIALQDAPELAAAAGPEVPAAVEAFWSTSVPYAFVGALERAFAMCCHVGFQLLVWLAVVKGRALLWVWAILAHATLDAGAVALMQTTNVATTEAFAGACAVVGLVFSVRTYRRRGGVDATNATGATDAMEGIVVSGDAALPSVAPLQLRRAPLAKVARTLDADAKADVSEALETTDDD